MTRLHVAPGLLEQSFLQFRRCGRGRNECVVYWTGPRAEGAVVDQVVHPRHRATRFGYEVESAWVTEFFLGLRRSSRTTRMQVHTHPTYAGHSSIDDCFALVPAPGFLSLVVPSLGLGEVELEDTVLVEMNAAGEWEDRDPGEVLVLG